MASRPIKRTQFVNVFDAVAHDAEQMFRPTPADKQTQFKPGSKEKIAVLAARAEQGAELWHPRDKMSQVDWMSRNGLGRLMLE